MAALGVAPPDVMTRVSEYLPEIVSYISTIIANGFAYESNGSVYFDVAAYSRSHVYGKLVPENVGNAEALAEGEGVLSQPGAASSLGAGDKRDASDFALWKRSKEGEPWWDSPWGRGRPGWHIECTAMCGETLGRFAGGPIDIHSGGVDLRFPHHDNEIAQSEAYYRHQQWVNYFLHSGHLHIEGLKMSKSLKNFIRISDALERYGPRQLRLFFLLQRYNSPMNYSERAMEAMAAIDKMYVEFFANTKARLRGLKPEGPCKWQPHDHAFASFLEGVKERVYACLADDFDTPGAMAQLAELVKEANKYMGLTSASAAAAGDASGEPVAFLLKAAGDYVTSMFKTFGLVDPVPAIGFPSSSSAAGGAGGESLEAALGPYLDALAAFRDKVRKAAQGGDVKSILAACDALRDDVLPPLGVVLEDTASAAAAASGSTSNSNNSSDSGAGAGAAVTDAAPSARWKLRDPAELKREVEEKARQAADKARKKAEAAAEAAKKAAEKETKAKIDPKAMFLAETDKYSKFDEEGVPTHDEKGEELPKGTVKRLKKDWAVQAKLFQWWQQKQAGGAAPSEDAGPAAE